MKFRILGTSSLTCVLLVMTSAMGAMWYKSSASQQAPQLGNYNWNEHPNTMLVVVPDDYCGCGASPTSLTLQALDNNLDVVIVSHKSGDLLKDIERMHPYPKHVTLLTKADSELFTRFCPKDNLGIVYIRNSHIDRVAVGSIPDDFFEVGRTA